MATVRAGTWVIAIVIFGATMVQGWWYPPDPEVCYGSLGCFNVRYPYTNTKRYLPRAPAVIGTKFLLFTRNALQRYQEIVVNDKVQTDTWTTFRGDRPTIMLIHGYRGNGLEQWIIDMMDALLKHGDFNVIVVDWENGANEYFYYYQSAANIRVVGAQVAALIKHLGLVYDTDPSTIHIIGHSLGAHAAGYAGERIEGIGRITGLDPAARAFRKTDTRARLDPDDALFVDIIHTDNDPRSYWDLGFGLHSALGNVDFYPNGGMDQPECPGNFLQRLIFFLSTFDIWETVGCSHFRAVDLFTESINSDCSFLAFPCTEINTTSSEMCRTCDGACAVMGFHTNTSTISGKYYLETNSSAPFCME